MGCFWYWHLRLFHSSCEQPQPSRGRTRSRARAKTVESRITNAHTLSYLIHASWLGERSPLGREAAPLARCSPPTTLNILGPASCCAGHHPSCPCFHLLVWFLGWSTARGILRSIHLLSCTYNKSDVRILMLFNIFFHPSRSSCLLPLRHIQLTQPRRYTPRLLAPPPLRAGVLLRHDWGGRRAHTQRTW
jgi:hypothetical protein